jgi:translation initiation factor IF-2
LAKKLKLNIKNTQIAKALNLKKIKLSAAGKKPTPKKKKKPEIKEEIKPKRKARILPPKEKPIKPKKEVPKKAPPKKEKEPLKPKKVSKKPKELIEKKEKEPPKKIEKKLPPKPIKEPPKKPEKEPPTPLKEKKLKKEWEEPKKKIKKPTYKAFDTRDRLGLRMGEEDRWRKKRPRKVFKTKEKIPVIRPKTLIVKIPISIKDLAAAMKLKASELISKLFSQGVVITLNDFLDDETTIQLLGHEFDCEITIDRTEEQKLQITDKTIKEEIEATNKENLKQRAPIITFMGHVDHGKTSIIDRIRKSNIAAQEAGSITQHIGAFLAKTSSGDITILDTPGHEAFTEMRERGATVTDIVVLVIAGDEGIKEQTIEAINQAKIASVPIIVAINKSDKEGFDPEKIYRQLSDQELLPEAWGGTTITINCSALKNEGIQELLEMISLQAEILELNANPSTRARGIILESQMHKGLGAIATVLIQNGSLKISDPLVFGVHWGRVKTMHNQNGELITEAGPAIPVKITGLSNLAEAGCEFIVVKDEKQAKELATKREKGVLRKKISLAKTALEKFTEEKKKILPIIIRADMQGSLEALENALKKIISKKIELNIISADVGEISESDIQLSSASNAPIIGFHTSIESHAESLIKELKVKVISHNIIYHAVDAVKKLMIDELEKIENEIITGEALIKTVFQSSQLGKIAGCVVTNGSLKRGQHAKLIRDDEEIWKGKIGSLKKVAEDVKEVQKGVECGIILENFSEIKEKDVIQAYNIEYLTPEL